MLTGTRSGFLLVEADVRQSALGNLSVNYEFSYFDPRTAPATTSPAAGGSPAGSG